MPKTKVVLDTNVLVSALGWKGVPGDVFEKCVKKELLLVISPAVLDEIKKTISEKKFDFISADEREQFILLLMELAENVSPTVKLDVIKADPKDNMILECAVAGNAGYIVSGDKHLLDLKEFSGIQIIKPGEFLKRI